MTETSAPPHTERPARARLNPLVVTLALVAGALLLLLATTVGAAMHYRGQYVEAVNERNDTVEKANVVIGEVKAERDQMVAGQEALLEQVTTCQILLKVQKHLYAGVDASIEGIEASQQNNQKWLAGRMQEVQRQLRAAEGVPSDAGFESAQDLALACAGEEGATS